MPHYKDKFGAIARTVNLSESSSGGFLSLIVQLRMLTTPKISARFELLQADAQLMNDPSTTFRINSMSAVLFSIIICILRLTPLDS